MMAGIFPNTHPKMTRRWFANRSFRVPRLWSNEELRRVCQIFGGTVVNVSAWRDEDKEGGHYRDYFPTATRYYTTNYEGIRGTAEDDGQTNFALDLSAPLPDKMCGRFDVVFNHTTLEHVFEMRQAFRNLCLMSRDVVIVVVPFAQEMHSTESFGDFWRFTPQGVRALFAENGLTTIYEATSPQRNAGVYLLSIGSLHPQRWQSRLPAWQPVRKVGEWIGRPAWQRFLAVVSSRWSVVSKH